MAGGLFVDKPFHPNLKCIIFGFVSMGLYLLGTYTSNWLLLPVIMVIAYVLMAWYDYMYSCEDRIMYSGTGSTNPLVTAIFKPQRRDEAAYVAPVVGELVENQESAFLHKVYIFHVLAVAPILFYVGIRGCNAGPKVFGVVLALAIVVLMYHGMRLWNPRDTSCEIKENLRVWGPGEIGYEPSAPQPNFIEPLTIKNEMLF